MFLIIAQFAKQSLKVICILVVLADWHLIVK